MFCDEPTSGLDSYMAQNIVQVRKTIFTSCNETIVIICCAVQVLKSIASKGKTVIFTIHQPSSEVFALFDRILLMAEGRVAFLGQSVDALSFFSSQGLPCPANYNPADFFIHTLATVPGNEVECRKRSKGMCDAYESSEGARAIRDAAVANRSIKTGQDLDVDSVAIKVKRSPYKAPWFTQFRAVLWRSMIAISREPAITRVRVFQTIVRCRGVSWKAQ